MGQKSTGFASPAQGYEEEAIDLNSLLIHNPPATIFARVESSDMENFGLLKGSLLVIDRSKYAHPNSLVMLRHEGQFYCRIYTVENGKTLFSNGKSAFPPTPEETEIIGVVTASIKEYTYAASHLPH
jgi:DNA polymerase V